MMKKCISLLLVLSLLIPGLAAAESAAPVYQPGSVIAGLFADAFAGGSVVCADLDLELALNKEKLGIADEDAEMVDAVLEVINTGILSAGAAKSEEGVTLVLSCVYAKEGAQTAANASVRVCLNEEGLYIETSLLPGERVTAKWETVLQMFGADQDTIAQILSLRDVDPNALIAQLEQMMQQALAVANQVGTPYLNTFVSFLQGLPISVAEDVAADGYFPAAKQEVALTLTQKAAGELLTALADQLSADPILSSILDMVLTNPDVMGSSAMTTAALCENVRALAAGMTDESTPVCAFIGYDESGAPLYAALQYTNAAGTTAVLNAINAAENADGPAHYIVELFTLDAQENYSGLYVSWMYEGNSADKNNFNFAGGLEFALQNTTIMSMEYAIGSAPVTTEENLPGYNGNQQLTVAIADPESGTTVNVVSSAEFQQFLTADGGETQMTYSVTDTYAGETAIQSTAESYFGAIPSEEGPLGLYVDTIIQPEAGIDNATISVNLYVIPNETPERTAVLALETAAQEDMDALVQRLVTSAQEQLSALTAQLPAAILEQLSGSSASEAAAM